MKKDKIIKSVLISIAVILAVLCAVMLKSCSTPQTLVKFEGSINNIQVEKNENRVILNITGVDADFVWYESDISIDYSENLKPGDSIVLFVQDNYNNVALARIYSLGVNGALVFDKTQSNFEENKQVSYMFAVMMIALCITLLFIAFKPLKDETKEENTFVIRAHKVAYYLGLCFCVTFLSGAIAAFILASVSSSAKVAGIVFLVMGALGGLIIYVYFSEKFIFNGQEFIYCRPIVKAKRALASEVKFVRIRVAGFPRIEFFNNNGKKLMSFMDDGTAFRTGEFIKTLQKLNLPIANSVYSSRFEETKKVLKMAIVNNNINNLHLRLRLFGQEYLLNCKKTGCEIQNVDGENLFTFSTFEELISAPVFNGLSLYKQWKKVEAFDILYYNDFDLLYYNNEK